MRHSSPQPRVPWPQRIPPSTEGPLGSSRSGHLTLNCAGEQTHLKKLKSMVEYLSWIRPQHAQRKWDACSRQNKDQKWAQSIPARGTSRLRLSWLGSKAPWL